MGLESLDSFLTALDARSGEEGFDSAAFVSDFQRGLNTTGINKSPGGIRDKGFLRETVEAVAGGVSDAAEMWMRAIRTVDPEGGNDIIRDFATSGISAIQNFVSKHPSLAPDNQVAEGVKRWWVEGVRSFVPSLSAALPGVVAGAAVGGPVGAVAGSTFGGAIFGLAEFDRFKDEVEGFITDNQLSQEQAADLREKARNPAIYSAITEGGLEGAANALEALSLGLFRPIRRTIQGVAAKPLKDIFKKPIGQIVKEAAVRLPRTAAIEVGTEMSQEALETKFRRDIGLTDMSSMEAAISVIGPSLVTTLLFMGAAGGANSLQRRGIKKALEDARVNPDRRQRAVTEIADIIRATGQEDSAELASRIQASGDRFIKEGLPIDLNTEAGVQSMLGELAIGLRFKDHSLEESKKLAGAIAEDLRTKDLLLSERIKATQLLQGLTAINNNFEAQAQAQEVPVTPKTRKRPKTASEKLRDLATETETGIPITEDIVEEPVADAVEALENVAAEVTPEEEIKGKIRADVEKQQRPSEIEALPQAGEGAVAEITSQKDFERARQELIDAGATEEEAQTEATKRVLGIERLTQEEQDQLLAGFDEEQPTPLINIPTEDLVSEFIALEDKKTLTDAEQTRQALLRKELVEERGQILPEAETEQEQAALPVAQLETINIQERPVSELDAPVQNAVKEEARLIEEEINQAVQGERIVRFGEETIGVPSTFPPYFAGLKGSKKAIRRALTKIREGKGDAGIMVDRIKTLIQDRLQGKQERFQPGSGIVEPTRSNRFVESGVQLSTGQRQPAPTFFSKLAKEVDSPKFPNKIGGQEALNLLTKTVKPEEIKWSGIEDFLKDKKSVTKQEIQDFVRANEVRIEETVLGGQGTGPTFTIRDGELLTTELRGVDNLGFETTQQAKNAILNHEDWISRWDVDNIPRLVELGNKFRESSKAFGAQQTKFSEYQLPGGGNYKEILLRLPYRPEHGVETLGEKGQYEVFHNREFIGRFANQNEASQWISAIENNPSNTIGERIGWEARPARIFTDIEKVAFQSTHFNEPNILAHVRYNERTSSEGEKVLFIEEIQSDWAQEGRKKGFVDPTVGISENFATFARRNGITDQKAIEKMFKERTSDLFKEWRETQDRVFANIGTIPNALLLKNWWEFTLKRMLREAVNQGHDRLAWITGKQTADRYDLSKQISTLQWRKRKNGNFDLLGIQKQGNQAFDKTDLKASELETWVGKEVAKKIEAGEGIERTGELNISSVVDREQVYESIGTLENQDLRVGGQWAFNLYDKTIPQFLNKFGKQFGAKVENVGIPTPSSTFIEREYVGEIPSIKKIDDTIKSVHGMDIDAKEVVIEQLETMRTVLAKGGDFKAVAAEKLSPRAAQFLGGKLTESPTRQYQSIPITPEMRKVATEQGFPLFSTSKRKGAINAAETTDIGTDTPAIRKLRNEIKREHNIDVAANAYTEQRVLGGVSDALESIAKTFGREVTFLKITDNAPFFNGAIITGDNNIYINTNSAEPLLFVLGHELTHQMQSARPKLYQEFVTEIEPFIKGLPEYQEFREKQQAAAGFDVKFTEKKAQSELIADFVGEQFLNEDFWIKLQTHNPSVFKRIVKMVKKILARALQGVTGTDVVSKQYFTDIEKAQNIAANALSLFEAQERSSKNYDEQANVASQKQSSDKAAQKDQIDVIEKTNEFIKSDQASKQPDLIDQFNAFITHNPGNVLNNDDSKRNIKAMFSDIKNEDITLAGRMFNLPYQKAKMFIEWKRALGIEIARSQNKHELMIEFGRRVFKRSQVKEGTKADVHEFIAIKDEKSLKRISAVLLEGDARRKEFTNEQLKDGISTTEIDKITDEYQEFSGKIVLTQEEVTAYRAWQVTMKRIRSKMVEANELMLFKPFQGEKWIEQLKSVVRKNSAKIQPEQAELGLPGQKKEKAEAIPPKLVAADLKGLDDTEQKAFIKAYNQIIAPHNGIQELRRQMGELKGYVPHLREEGSVKISFVDKDGQVQDSSILKNKRDAQAYVEERTAFHKRKGNDYTLLKPETVSKTPEFLYQDVSAAALERFSNKAFDRFKLSKEGRAPGKITAEDLEGIREGMRQALADELSARGFGERTLRRARETNIAGYRVTKLQDILHGYISGSSGFMTKMDAAYQQGQLLSEIDVKTKPNLYEEISIYGRNMMRNLTRADQVSSKIRTFAFMWYLSGQLKSPAVNFTQNYILGIPELAKFTTGATRKYHRAMLDISTGRLNDMEKKALLAAQKRGDTGDQLMQEIFGQTNLNTHKYLHNLIKVLSFPFSASEVLNRKFAFLARFRAGIEKGESFEQASEAATKFIFDVHFLYGKLNQPIISTGGTPFSNIVRTSLTFRMYTFSYINAMKNHIGNRDFMLVGRSMAYMALLGGLSSLPFLDDFLDMWERFTGIPIRKKIQQELKGIGGDVLAVLGTQGLPSLLGVDLSGSLRIHLPDPTDPARLFEESVFGVYEGLAVKAKDSFQSILDGEPLRALEQAAPIFIEKPLNAMRVRRDGRVTTKTGKTIFTDRGKVLKLSGLEAAVQAIGFRPANLAYESGKFRQFTNVESNFQNRRTALFRRFRFAKTSDDRRDVLTAIREYNKEARELRGAVPLITPETLRKTQKEQPSKRFVRFSR